MSTASLRLRPAVAGGVRPRARSLRGAPGAAAAVAGIPPQQPQRHLGSPHSRGVDSRRWGHDLASSQQLRMRAIAGSGGRRRCRLAVKAHGGHSHGNQGKDSSPPNGKSLCRPRPETRPLSFEPTLFVNLEKGPLSVTVLLPVVFFFFNCVSGVGDCCQAVCRRIPSSTGHDS